jgi:hypothetical protein
MISQTEIETYAVQIAEPGFEVSKANIDRLVGHLDPADYKAVAERSMQIAKEVGGAYLAEARALENLQRLAQATGMPEGDMAIPWLQVRGLIKEVDGRWFFKKPGPKSEP